MNLLKNWRIKVYHGLMLALVLIPGTALSETWDQSLDLTIPSLEMQSTWQLDSKDKLAITMGFECCYHNSLLESVKREASLKSIEYKSKANLKGLQFSNKYSKKELYYFWAINAVDVWTTHRGLKEPNIKEANPLLGEDPSLDRLILFKIVWGNLLLEVWEKDNLHLPNSIVTLATINNLTVLHNNDIIF